MEVYDSGSIVSSTFYLSKSDGSTLNAVSASYTLLGKSDDIIIPSTPVSPYVAGDVYITLTITGINNMIAGTDRTDVRKIVLTVVDVDGVVTVFEKIYLIQSAYSMSFMSGSYQTMQEAELTAFDLSGIDNFRAASDENKRIALIEAFHHLGMMTYSVNMNDGHVEYTTEFNTGASNQSINFLTGSVILHKINLMTPEYVSRLSSNFLKKLKMAQVIEADVILGGDSIFDKRKDGLLSETVGESSTMWRSGKPLLLPVSRRALEVLTGYIHYGSKLGRG